MGSKSFSILNAIEKNKLASSVSFLVLMEIQLVDTDTGATTETVYVANNNEDITYQSNIYVAFPFSLKMTQEAGATPKITMSATDFQKVLATKMALLSGATGSKVIMRIVASDNLTADPELEEVFEVIDSGYNDYTINVQLGAEDPLRKRFPRGIQMRDRCRWRYLSPECGYVGAEPSCDLTLQGPNGCSFHDNDINFGGYPGLKGRGIRYG